MLQPGRWRPTRHIFGPVRDPVNLARRQRVLMLQQAANPERNGIEMPMDADAATAQIFRSRNIGIHAYHDAAMIESAMRKYRNRSDRRAAAF